MNEFKTLQFQGIGTHWWIDLPEDSSERLVSEIQLKLLKTLNEFEDNYSRFKETSLVSKLNNQKHLENFPIELYEMLKLSENVKEISEGHFNVCIGSHLENLGYDKNYSFKSSNKNLTDKKLQIERLTPEFIQISPETKIDLGGIGKGWLIEKFIKDIKSFKLEKFIINGGGDIYVFDKTGQSHQFALENPFDNTEMIGTIEISNKAIACSSPSKRSWKDKNTQKLNHHLVDFKSGKSFNEKLAVFTESKGILNADLASTAIFVSPLELAKNIAKELKIEYLIIFPTSEFIKSGNYNGKLFSNN